MVVKVTLEAARPEAEEILECLERRRLEEEGVVLCLDRGAAPLWNVVLYWPVEDPAEADARTRACLGTDAFGAPIECELLDEGADWVGESLAGLSPVRVGRYIVFGGHDRDELPPSGLRIQIDAGQAFGTGHHGTTAGCLEAIDRLLRRRAFSRVLDIGTGSGILAIAVAKAARGRILATDIDPLAVAIARENAALNRVARRATFVHAAGVRSATIRSNGPFDLIVANILARPLIRLAPDVAPLLAPGGWVVLSGLLPDQRSRVVHAYAAAGVYLDRSYERNGWTTLLLRSGGRRPISPICGWGRGRDRRDKR